MITKDVKNMWVDEQGNTCFGIRPESEKTPIPDKSGEKDLKEEEVHENDNKKTVKNNRRKRP